MQREDSFPSFADRPMPATYHRVARTLFPLESLPEDLKKEFVQVNDQLEQFEVLVNTGPPDWGVTLGLALGAQSHGALGAAVACAATLGDAVDVAEQYASVRAPFLRFVQGLDADTLVLRVQVSDVVVDQARRSVLEAAMLSALSLLSSSSGGRGADFTLNFSWPEPAWSAAYSEAGIRARFDQPDNTLTFSGGRDTANPLADQTLFDQAVGELQRRSSKMVASTDLPAQISTILDTCDRTYPTLTQLAADPNMSPRTLGRRLANRDTTYRDVLDAYRRQRAAVLLADMSSTVAGVAAELGYSDTSNFVRAHRRWHGRSPRNP